MNFQEAIKELKQGKTVTRQCWLPEDGYLVFMPGMRNIWKITFSPNVNAGNNLFSVEDYDAEDWQVSNGANPKVEGEANAS